MPIWLPAVMVLGMVATAPAASTEARFLALGDSYTIGESVAPELRWPVQLAAALNAAGVPVANPHIIARTGWTTDELSAAIDQNPPEGQFELVSLLIGVNNQYRGRPVDEFRLEFRALLQRAIGFGSRKSASQLLVLSIPDWGVTPFAADRDRALITAQINQYNQAKREETLAAGAAWIEITSLTREAVADPELVAGDGLHPSGKDYRRWAERAMPAARKVLAPP